MICQFWIFISFKNIKLLKFTKLKCKVFGISADSVAKHEKFVEKFLNIGCIGMIVGAGACLSAMGTHSHTATYLGMALTMVGYGVDDFFYMQKIEEREDAEKKKILSSVVQGVIKSKE
jgi:hypothetical protein